MNLEAPAEHTPASVPLQVSPITPNLAPDTSLPMPSEVAPQVPARTRMSIETTVLPSGKKLTITAKVFTNSRETPTGTVMFQVGRKVGQRAPLDNGIASICVSAMRVRGPISASYSGDHHHLTSTVKLAAIAKPAKAELAAPTKKAPPTQAVQVEDNDEDPASGGAIPENPEKTTPLENEITGLWFSHQLRGRQIRSTRVERDGFREKLAERLTEYHTLLARAGRDGRWMEFLREADIPKSTAERYMAKWKLSKMPELVSRPIGTIQAPSEEEIGGMVKKVKGQVQRVLTTPESVTHFLTELTAALRPPTSTA